MHGSHDRPGRDYLYDTVFIHNDTSIERVRSSSKHSIRIRLTYHHGLPKSVTCIGSVT